MKKMISLAVILSCVLSVPAFADGPNGDAANLLI